MGRPASLLSIVLVNTFSFLGGLWTGERVFFEGESQSDSIHKTAEIIAKLVAVLFS